uniref:hypothetical protein n=1 Tax=Polynucleobacter sp. TaxID=2029855 RepID=UPI004047E368
MFLIGCSAADSNTYTLYRSSTVGAFMRVHIATFNADEDESYNKENCETAQELFQKQPGVTVKFWCEKGKYRK